MQQKRRLFAKQNKKEQEKVDKLTNEKVLSFADNKRVLMALTKEKSQIKGHIFWDLMKTQIK